MRKSLFLYLFIIAVLFNIFTYMYFTKKSASEQEGVTTDVKIIRDSLNLATTQLADANYFSLENNQNAQNYFDRDDNKMIPYEKLIPHVKEKLMDLNDNPKGNPYTGQDRIGTNKFIINKVKVINHRWIIADYSDGEYWGEVLLKYFVNEDETISFEVIQSLIYQNK